MDIPAILFIREVFFRITTGIHNGLLLAHTGYAGFIGKHQRRHVFANFEGIGGTHHKRITRNELPFLGKPVKTEGSVLCI